MSQWTHVNASIRFDSLLGIRLPTKEEFGKIADWNDDDTAHWNTTPLPCGSEGSIKYQIVKNPNPNDFAAMVVVFYGDLRDYDDHDEILNYFSNLTKNKFIRSGILEIEVEFKKTLIYSHNSEKEKWELKHEMISK